MKNKLIACLTLAMIGALALSAAAGNKPAERRVVSFQVDRAMSYSFSEEPRTLAPAEPDAAELPSLGTPAMSFYNESPGVEIGSTWYDKQHNGTIGRMIDWGTDPVSGLIVHFNWMKLPLVNNSRHYRYNAWVTLIDTFAFDGGIAVQPSDQYAGFVGIDVTPDNRAVVGGHVNPGNGTYQSHFYFDGCPACGAFTPRQARVPDALALCAQITGGTEAIWPKFRYQIGSDTILHVFSQGSEAGAGTPQAITYFRRRAPETAPPGDGWLECRVMDSVFCIAQDIGASKTSDRIVLAWTANLPPVGSNPWESDNQGGSQFNNDLFIATSVDQGAHFDSYAGSDRFNLTMSDSTVDGFRVYTTLNLLIDSEDVVHVVWSGRYWPADPNAPLFWNCRLFHWSETIGFMPMEDGSPGGPNITPGNQRVVYDANWTIGTGPDQSQCTGGSWAMNIMDMSISECDGKFYVVWTQFNDPLNGVNDDCAARAAGGTGDIGGAGNGELWLSVSNDAGVNWDQSRNLTNSYSGGCDPNGAAGPCESDGWPSVARFGTNEPGSFPSEALLDPSVNGVDSPYVGDYYLDVQYINDLDAGDIVSTEGTWQNSPVKWFRMACVEPVPDPSFEPSWTQIDYPAYTQHGVQLDTALTITNGGNVSYDYVISIEEDTGPSGWLTHSGFSGTVHSGLEPTDTGMVHLNTGGIVNAPGAVVELLGRLIFTSNASSSPDTLPIRLFVAPELNAPVLDTVRSGCLSLVVNTDGNFGNHGMGRVNLDFYDAGDCDTNAKVVLYDGTPIIGWLEESDTVMHWSIYGDSWLAETGYFPQAHVPVTDSGDYEVSLTNFVTHDTSLMIEQTFFAPTNVDSCNFMIHRLRITSADGQDHSGLIIGQALDWDLASDSGSDNGSGFDSQRDLIYQFGGEYNDTTTDCQSEALRYAGVAFIESRTNNDCLRNQDEFYGAYTANSGRWIYPTGSFVRSELYENMLGGPGLSVYTNPNPDSALIDLHTVVTYDTNIFIGTESVLTYYSILASVLDGGLAELQQTIDAAGQWYIDHIKPAEPEDSLCSCCRVLCDFDSSSGVDVADVTLYVDYLFRGGLPPVCEVDAGYCDMVESTNVADLTYIVDYLFNGGAPPGECGEI